MNISQDSWRPRQVGRGANLDGKHFHHNRSVPPSGKMPSPGLRPWLTCQRASGAGCLRFRFLLSPIDFSSWLAEQRTTSPRAEREIPHPYSPAEENAGLLTGIRDD